jgi:hypothetical protein
MKKIAFAFAAAATLAVVPAFAQDSSGGGDGSSTTTAAAAPAAAPAAGGGGGTGVELGLRVGYGIPLGDAVKNVKMSDAGYKGKIPIRLDAGYRVTPNIMVGVYFAYGIIMIDKDKACGGADCSAHSLDFGVQAAYHIMPDQSMDPWVGLGIGLEQISGSVSSVDFGIKGLTFAEIQAGLDFKAGGNLMVGPFLGFALGQYSTVTAAGNSADITDKGMHEWLTIGVRGAYGIW